ncbi:di-heme-cytochrome C peroxidase [Methylocystis sp. 9N]|uniref:Di-heme-cytochrome C peroxidase n=1 Tax=Methylocystis borbori TaxID=3118750 RepID=A0ABU7XJE6_9HYPH
MFTSRPFFASLAALAMTAHVSAAELKYADQGVKWTQASRTEFYSLDQGARIMPFAWIKALRHPDGARFLADGLGRYGYLPNPDSETPGLPVGFLSASENSAQYFSMTCSACHTRQIDVGGVSWRIDGGPALVDFQSLLNDIDLAFKKILSDDAAFKQFAQDVLGGDPTPRELQHLRRDVDVWFAPYDTIVRKSLPSPGWGVGRLDAVSMIFNRVAGLDIGATHSRIIENNITWADAAVRYPFLWNAPIQDFTQWPGFAENGDDILGLARNVGEVYGVFGVYRPKQTILPNVIDYLNDSSLNYPGLMRLETLIKQIAPPKWPWSLDQALVSKGAEIFNRDPKNGGCAKGCHEIAKGAPRVCNFQGTWRTPLEDVGTDSREYQVLAREAETGVLNGARIAFIPGVDKPLKPKDKIISILGLSVIGSIIEAPLHFGLDVFQPILDDCLPAAAQASPESAKLLVRNKLAAALKNLYTKPAAQPSFKYESRVMQGIWAAAPYLHNGSVPTLADLLKPVAERPASFKVGTAYDVESVGLAKEQGAFSTLYTADDCAKRDSGNSRCGHTFGVNLTPDEKKALLEYLKSL